MSTDRRPCHIVQIGSDDSAFTLGPTAEYVRRQQTYGAWLARERPGSRLTLLTFTAQRAARLWQIDNLVCQPLVVERRGLAKFGAWYRLAAALSQIDRARRIDVLTTQTVHDEAWVVLGFARRRRRPLIGQIHYDLFNPYAQTEFTQRRFGRARYQLLLALLKHFSALRVVSHGLAQTITQRRLHARVHVIPVPMALLAEAAAGARTAKASRVLYVGRLAPEKNLPLWLDVAARVAAQVPEATFEIAGEGSIRPELEAASERNGLRGKVHFSGFVPYAQLAAVYQAASVLLLTSHYEGFGRVAAEALSQRVPVVAPRLSGLADIVTPERAGFLHAPGDVEEMAASVVRLLRDPALAESLGRYGENEVKRKFDPAALSRRWMQLLIAYAESADDPAA